MNHKSLFFKYVIPSIIAFALSGIYAIVDGYFVGNTIGDAGLSAINIAYPIEALIQALGTGIGMGGAVYYSINAAEKKGKRAEEFIATSWWLLVIVSVISTIIIYSFSSKILGLLGVDGIILTNATDYIKIIALGAILQILGTGMMLSHYHHFKWWFELALIRAGYMLAQKGGYRKHCYWSAIKRYFLNLLFLTLLPALLYISLLPLL